MVSPQELRAAMAKADEEALHELETAIDATLKKEWTGDSNHRVVFLLVGAYPRRVVDQTISRYKDKGWRVDYNAGGQYEDSLTFSEAPAAPGIVCRCPNGMHVRGCGAVLRNPQ